jgi:hypothetical protein
MPAAALIGTAFQVPPCGMTFLARSGSSGREEIGAADERA